MIAWFQISKMFGSLVWEALEFLWALLRWTAGLMEIFVSMASLISFGESLLERTRTLWLTLLLVLFESTLILIRWFDAMVPLLKEVALLLLSCLVFIEGELEGTLLLIAFWIATKLRFPRSDPFLIVHYTRNGAISRLTTLLLSLETSSALFSLFCHCIFCIA